MKPRPILRYHGGKHALAKWIISYFPEHKVYVEPYGGAASVLFQKPRSYAEIYNELDPEIVNLFEVVRYQGDKLKKMLALTPFSRIEFFGAYLPGKNSLERARKTVIKSFMGFGSDAIKHKSGFRANSHRSGTTPAHDWVSYSDKLDMLIDRLKGVVIENKDAFEVIKQHDSLNTLIYADPPYVHSTRSSSKSYQFEMSDEQHRELADLLKNCQSKVIVSGYGSELYDYLYKDWWRVEKEALADGARKRTEVLWMNFQPANNSLL